MFAFFGQIAASSVAYPLMGKVGVQEEHICPARSPQVAGVSSFRHDRVLFQYSAELSRRFSVVEAQHATEPFASRDRA